MRRTVKYRPNAQNTNGGFMLLDLALTIFFSGIIIAGAIHLVTHSRERTDMLDTNRRMAYVTKAFSNYAQQRFRLPCPADPGAGAPPYGVERAACTGGTAMQGIVPYQTLGIPEQYVRDGYGRYFTYVVSPVFTRNNQVFNSGTNSGDVVHERLAHMASAQNAALLPKIAFCTTVPQVGAVTVNQNTDVVVRQDGSAFVPSATARMDSTSAPYPYRTQPYNSAGLPDPNYFRTDAVSTFAMALISHGANGQGAYMPNGAQETGLGTAGASEQNTWQNTAATRDVWIDSAINRSGNAAHYDDIVVVLTQEQVYAVAGGGSCEDP